jgi:hypothetical protein
MQPPLIRGERIPRPDGQKVVPQGAEDREGGEGYEGVEQVSVGLDRAAVFVGDVEVGEQQAAPEVGAPGEGVPVVEDAEGVVAEALPGGLDFGDDYYAEQYEPGVLELDGDGPEDA